MRIPEAEHNIRIPGWAWSLILAATAFARSFISLSEWVPVLIIGGTLVAVGMIVWIITSKAWAAAPSFVGHVALLAVDFTTISVVLTTDDTSLVEWLVSVLLVLSATLHVERILCIGTNIRSFVLRRLER